jgi:holliday junction DNA helicase RuvA
MAQAEDQLPDIGIEVKVFVHQVVRENEIFLCGFLRLEERALFLNLIKVSGVGPTMALQILGQTSLQKVVSDIIGGQVAALIQIKGVGKKTAERIILELRDKLKGEAFVSSSPLASSKTVWPEDALLALIALGLNPDRARDRLEALAKESAPPVHVDEWIKKALKHGA